MILTIHSIYDSAVKAYLRPFFARSKGEALRMFTEAANDTKGDIRKHASDYRLVYLGEFDDVLGVFNPAQPEAMITALDVLDDDALFPPEKEIKTPRMPM